MNPAKVYLSKVSNQNKFEKCPQLTINPLNRCHRHRSSVSCLILNSFFYPFNFAITEIYVAILLAEDRTRMDSL